MPLADWEMSYNGLTFGADQNVRTISVEGLDPGAYRYDYHENVMADGGWLFTGFVPERHVLIFGDVSDPTHAIVPTLYTTFAPRTTDLALGFKLPGFVEKKVMARPVRFNLPVDRDYNIGYFKFAVELIAATPAIVNGP